jgi:hypothetical protein
LSRGAKKAPAHRAKWLSEVVDRAIARRFEGAGDYAVIQPAAGSAHAR